MSAACPHCSEPTVPDASWCEACGGDLSDLSSPPATETASGTAEAVSPCVDCAAAADQILDGYCMQCGHKQPAPRDHLVCDLGSVAGVTDRGRRHRRNEDAMALDVFDGGAVVVVCDGVSTTDNPDQASQAAADTALSVLHAAATSGTPLDEAMVSAAAAAQTAVLEVPRLPDASSSGNPSCTFVAAVWARADDGSAVVTVGWLGDSRAYWFGAAGSEADGAALLSTDHSWAAEMSASGLLTDAEAHAHPRAHTITRWLGADAPELEPTIAEHQLPVGGRLLLCSDGLWNYAATPEELAARPEWQFDGPLAQAEGLTRFANDAGGHDNITVVVADTTPTTPTTSTTVDTTVEKASAP